MAAWPSSDYHLLVKLASDNKLVFFLFWIFWLRFELEALGQQTSTNVFLLSFGMECVIGFSIFWLKYFDFLLCEDTKLDYDAIKKLKKIILFFISYYSYGIFFTILIDIKN